MSGNGHGNNIPDAVHKKLICVAKRGRFSHVVAPRVWQAPDDRVLEVLDDAEAPLDAEFYAAFKQFEQEEYARLCEEDKLEESAVVSEVPKDPVQPVQDKEAVVVKADQISGFQTVSVSKPANAARPNNGMKGILAFVQKAKPNSEQLAVTGQPSSSRSNDEHAMNVSAGRSADLPSLSGSRPDIFGTSVPPLVSNETQKNNGTQDSRSEEDVQIAQKLGLCKAHRWNALLMARCFLPNDRSQMQSRCPGCSLDSSSGSVIVWFRYGCLRLEKNLAFQQALWLRKNHRCTISCVALIDPSRAMQSIDGRAQLTALRDIDRRLRDLHGLRLTVFDADEAAHATSLFAMWSRQATPAKVVCLLTGETYVNPKLTLAVSRAIPCPLFAFDSDNPVPLHKLLHGLGMVFQTMETFTAFIKSKAQPVPTFDHSLKLHEEQINPPGILTQRWRTLDLEPQTNGLDQSWTESNIKASLTGVTDGQLLSHVRLGTLSPLDSPAALLDRRSFLLYRLYVSHTVRSVSERSITNEQRTKLNEQVFSDHFLDIPLWRSTLGEGSISSTDPFYSVLETSLVGVRALDGHCIL